MLSDVTPAPPPAAARPSRGTVAARRGAGIVWARVEDGFHVANRDGIFLGYLDREADGTWLVFNGRSACVGREAGLREAMHALIAHYEPEPQAVA
ncbi:hypothetical protein [Microbacterium xanthum]|uniref:hypothetical protein n=1 Tax=Microbacterium xanthum TaxID=3079794 RepID=UPI002AD2997C|nr:hypothetical protein [Microbacterium sp. KSW-48]MDZ8170786.1 hypothetical protein [Microbacterium sp. KSW-48]